jgi:hypothetical protein
MGLFRRILVGSSPEPPPVAPLNPAHDPNLLARLDNLEGAMRALKLEWENTYDKIAVRLGRLARMKQQLERQEPPGPTNGEEGKVQEAHTPGDLLRQARARYGRPR